MAINFPNSPSNGAQHTASGITWTYDGTTWKADGITSSYTLPTASSTLLGGVKIGSGITINTGTISSTLQSVVDSNSTCTSEVFIQNKLYFSNNFASLTDLQAVSASTYHGMFAHVHATGHGYFAHAGGWQQLIDTASSIGELGDVDLSSAPTDGQVLKWVAASSNWVAGTVSGGGGSYANSDVDTHLNVSGASSGQILSWNGSDYAWVADQTGGGGSSLTIQDEGNALAVDATTLNFVGAGVLASGTGATKTITISAAVTAPPTISWTLTAPNSDHYVISGDGFVTGQSDPDLYLIRGQTYKFVNNAGAHPFRIQSTVAQAGGGTQYNDGVTNNDAGNGVTLTFVVPMNAPDTLYYQCTSHTAMFGTINILSQGAGSGLGARATVSATTNSIANSAQDVLTITGYKSYVLLSVKPSVASWVTIYTDSASRTADNNRVQGADPAPDAGVIAEVITTAAASEVKMTPGVIGWNNDNPPSTQIYAKVVNLSGSTAAVNVELKLLKLEA